MIREVIESFFTGMESWQYYNSLIDLLLIITVILIFLFIVKIFKWITNITFRFIGRRY